VICWGSAATATIALWTSHHLDEMLGGIFSKIGILERGEISGLDVSK